MWKQGKQVPPAVLATFVIDTGADTTMVNDQLMRTLGLTPTGATQLITSASQGVSEHCDVYDIELQIVGRGGQSPWTLQPLEVLGRPLINQSIEGMIGRDILDMAILHYDGPAQQFTLDYPGDATVAPDDLTG